MPATKDTSDTIIIKKYANRRLYDTSKSTYVTLDHLSDLVRDGVDFEVVDAKTGESITRQVLTQIIFEKETKGEGALPVTFLRKLIGFYGEESHNLLSAWLEMSINSFTESQEKWAKTMSGSPANPFALLEQQARANVDMFERAMRLFTLNSSDSSSMKAKDTATQDDENSANDPFDILRMQMQAIQSRLDALSGKR